MTPAYKGPCMMKMMNEGSASRSARLRRVSVGLKLIANGRVGDVVAKP